MTVGALAAGSLVLAPAASAAPTDARVTEIHYDDAGGDEGESIEVTAPTNADLTGLRIHLYNSNGGTVYSATAGIPVPAGTDGVAVLTFPTDGVQNGSPDGIALVDATGTVLEFLSYEGTFTAVGGPANGLTSTDIGVSENGAPEGQSLQRLPLGTGWGDWTGPASNTFGTRNGGSTPDPDPEPAELTCDAGTVTIGSVQGPADASLRDGQTVTVAGTVVGDLQEGGFAGVHVQDGGDGDDATSDGIFVYGSSLPPLELGDSVVVRGTVDEYNGLTELTAPTAVACGTAALPEAAVLPLPSTDAEREAFEGMLVAPSETLTVTEVFDLTSYGELLLASGGRLLAPTEAAEPGDPARRVAEENARRSIVLDDGRTTDLSPDDAPLLEPPYLEPGGPVRVGDTAVLEPVVLSYGFGNWRLQPADGTAEGATFEATNPRPAAPAEIEGALRIADFNVLNYFVDFPSEHGDDARGAPDAEELAEQQAKIVAAITALDADVITLHEIENSAVLTPDTPYRAVETLLAAVEAADGHDWDFVRAHEDTDVITNAIVYRTDRVTAVGEPVVPADLTAFANARTPIAQTFSYDDEVFSVIANHLKSKGSACTAGNDTSVGGPGNCNADRVRQAEVLVDLAATVAGTAGDDDVLLTGDFNSYRFEDPLDVLREAGFQEVDTPGRHTYVFDGGSGSLDHVFASPSMFPKVTGHTIWDTNAVESYAYQYDGYEPLFAPDPYRASDHNPSVVGITPETVEVPASASLSDAAPFRGDRVTVSGTGFTAGTTVRATLPARGGEVLGTATAAEDGTVTLSFRVPVLLPQGSYQVVLSAADGETAATSFTLRPVLQEAWLRLLGWLGG
ncbi:ExeM/NucH family extracellular endonuclease [Blastococcus sp. SYSU D00669]